MSLKNSKRGGFIGTIVLIVVGLIILGYLGYNIKDIIESDLVQKNLSYVWNIVKGGVKMLFDVVIKAINLIKSAV